MLDGNKAGEIWAIALSEDGQYLAATSVDGRINVWDNLANGAKIREFETKGSFGMCIDLVCSKSTFRYVRSDDFLSLWMGDLQHLDTKTEVFTFSIMTQVAFSIHYQVSILELMSPDMSLLILSKALSNLYGQLHSPQEVSYSLQLATRKLLHSTTSLLANK